MGETRLTKTKEIKKHVATIHCSNSLSLLQRKISNVLLYHAYGDLLTTETHQITVKQVCTLIGCNSNNHAVIKQALKGLLSTVIEWNIVDAQTREEDWSASSILASVRIKGSICSYSYSPRMRELLHSPSIYGKINLDVQARFKSNYGLALYENCARYKLLPNTKWFELDVFRRLMGVPADIYPIFRDFKKRVLDKAVEEVNTYSDLFVQYELERVGRKVAKLRFQLETRPKKPKFSSFGKKQSSCVSPQLIQELHSDFAIGSELAQKLLQKYGEEVVQKKIDLIKQSNSYVKGTIENLAGYLQSALAQDYQPTQSSAVKLSKRLRVKEERSRVENLEKEKLQKDYDAYIRKETDRILGTFTEKQTGEALEKFDQHMLKLPMRKIVEEYKQRGMESKRVLSIYRTVIREMYPTLFQLLSYDEFIQKTAKKQSNG